MKIYIARHSYSDVPLHTNSLLRLQKRFIQLGIELVFAAPFFDSHINRGRNRCADNFLKTDATHLLTVDSDIIFEPETLERCIKSGYDFCGAPYPMKDPNRKHVIGNFIEPYNIDENGFVEAHDIGCGFMLLSRTVFEKLAEHAPVVHSDIVGAGFGDQYHVFYDSGADGKQYLTEDWWLSRAWRSIGGKCWLDGQAQLGHFGGFIYTPSGTVLEAIGRERAQMAIDAANNERNAAFRRDGMNGNGENMREFGGKAGQ